jgi:transposase-like protein
MKPKKEKASITIREFFTQFPTDESCVAHLFETRYGQGHVCPKCERGARWYRIQAERAYSCQWCGHHLHPTVGTPFEDTRTPLQLWFYAIYLFTTSRHGVPAKELERQLGVTYKTAWRMAHLIRTHMANVDGDWALCGDVEVDETYIGGSRKGPAYKGRSVKNKAVVFGMLQRDGSIITKVVPNAQKKTLQPAIEENIAKGATVHSDQLSSYQDLGKLGYTHTTVDHGREEYVNGAAHVNGVENFWKHLKGSINGTHMSVSKKHLSKYTKEFEYRFNQREKPAKMFPSLVSQFPQP